MSQWLNFYKVYGAKAMITWQETPSTLILLKVYEPERLPSLPQWTYSKSLGIKGEMRFTWNWSGALISHEPWSLIGTYWNLFVYYRRKTMFSGLSTACHTFVQPTVNCETLYSVLTERRLNVTIYPKTGLKPRRWVGLLVKDCDGTEWGERNASSSLPWAVMWVQGQLGNLVRVTSKENLKRGKKNVTQ